MKYLKITVCIFLIAVLFAGCGVFRLHSIDEETVPAETIQAPQGTDAPSASGTTFPDDLTQNAAETEPPEEADEVPTIASVSPPLPFDKYTDKKVREIISSMTLKEKVGQLFIVVPESLSGEPPAQGITKDSDKPAQTSASPMLCAELKKYRVGGVVMFGQNIVAPTQTKEFIAGLQKATSIPLFIAVDEEGGPIARIASSPEFNVTKYKSAAAVGDTGDTDNAKKMGCTIGTYLKSYGFNMDFAPVADVNSNPANHVIGIRSFSGSPAAAASMAGAAASGLIASGVLPTLKHFPGHGDTSEDSHVSLAVNYHDLDRLMSDDWLPYLRNDISGCAVMVSHIALPNVTGRTESAVIDSGIISEYLRGVIGFNGPVITDSLEMQAITDRYDTGTVCIKAIKAGCDILLMPQNFSAAYDAVLAAVENGEISEERLDESLFRILKAKFEYGIIRYE